MGRSAKRVEQYLCATPGWSSRRNVENHLIVDPAKAPIDVRLLRELLLEQSDAHARQGSLERAELTGEVHGRRVRLSGPSRNLEVSEPPLLRWRRCDSPGETMDRRG